RSPCFHRTLSSARGWRGRCEACPPTLRHIKDWPLRVRGLLHCWRMDTDLAPRHDKFRVVSRLDSAALLCQDIAMTKLCLALAGTVSIAACAFGAEYTVHTWKKIQLTDRFW